MSEVKMKRNLKSILKYLIFVVITALVTTVIFKLSTQFNQYENNKTIHGKMDIANKQLLYANKNHNNKIDWHDWEFTNIEKQRTGNIFISGLNLILVYYFDVSKFNYIQVLVNKELALPCQHSIDINMMSCIK